jgi:type IV pilus assembly protein PilM
MAGPAVGLDVGPGELRGVEVTGRGVQRVASRATAAVDDRGDIVDRALLAEDLRHLWKSGGFRSRSVVVGLTSTSIAARPVEFPAVPPEHARSAARYEVEELLAFSLDSAVTGVQIWPAPADAETTRALVIAAPAALTEAVISSLSDARLHPVDIRVSAASLAALLSSGTVGGEVVVDVGAARSSVSICEGGIPRLIRQIAAGAEPGGSVTEELELELVRIQGFRHQGTVTPAEQPSAEAMRLGPIVEAVRTSIGFHVGQRDARAIESITVTGTHRSAAGLDTLLTRLLGLPVVVAPPLSPDGVADAAAALVLGPRTSDLSLMPAAVNTARRYRRALLGSVGAAAILGAGLYTLSAASAAEIDDLEAQADGVERQYAAASSALVDLQPVLDADHEAATLRRDVRRALDGDVDWRRVLAATTNAMPADSWLTSFRGQRRAPAVGDAADAARRSGDVTYSVVGIDQTTVGRWLIAAGDVPGLVEPHLGQSTLAAIGPFGANRVLFTVTSDLSGDAESDRAARAVAAGEP